MTQLSISPGFDLEEVWVNLSLSVLLVYNRETKLSKCADYWYDFSAGHGL